MRTLVNESAADEALLGEIADSPATWWGVQRKINEQKAEVKSPWPPVNNVLKWLVGGAAMTAVAASILTLLLFRPASNNDKGTVAVLSPVSTTIEKPADTVNAPSEPVATEAKVPKGSNAARQVVNHIAARPRTAEKGTQTAVKTEVAAKTAPKEEIKTDFIALSYARDPESGQIVRVKVPSAMMVSLGLVSSVKTPTDMVDAEVLVGDDGLTRAIRFIR